jgi:hypothetical protein
MAESVPRLDEQAIAIAVGDVDDPFVRSDRIRRSTRVRFPSASYSSFTTRPPLSSTDASRAASSYRQRIATFSARLDVRTSRATPYGRSPVIGSPATGSKSSTPPSASTTRQAFAPVLVIA